MKNVLDGSVALTVVSVVVLIGGLICIWMGARPRIYLPILTLGLASSIASSILSTIWMHRIDRFYRRSSSSPSSFSSS